MTAPFLALITPIGGGNGGGGNYPDNSLPGGQGGRPSHPIYWPSYPDQGLPPFPSHPIAPGGGGGGGGGQPGYPSHPIYNPPYPDQGLPPFPSHPISPGGGGRPPYPDQGLPPFPSHPISPGGGGGGGNQPGYPTHPIYFPDIPTHPIELPPDLPPVDGSNRPIDWKVGWTPETGWVVIGLPQAPHPAPSK